MVSALQAERQWSLGLVPLNFVSTLKEQQFSSLPFVSEWFNHDIVQCWCFKLSHTLFQEKSQQEFLLYVQYQGHKWALKGFYIEAPNVFIPMHFEFLINVCIDINVYFWMCNMIALFSVQYFCMNFKPAVSAAHLKHNDDDRTRENEPVSSGLTRTVWCWNPFLITWECADGTIFLKTSK